MTFFELFKNCWMVAGVIAALVSLPGSAELLFLSLGPLFRRRRVLASWKPLKIAAVIPAHNESAGIAACVLNVVSANRDRIDLTVVVVADNCTDDTAVIAQNAGARVLVRNNPELRGKGYALDYAFRTLAQEGFEAFAIIDADSEIASNFFNVAAAHISDGANALQSRYLVRNPKESARTRLMNVALLAFNVLRPMGRSAWGLSAGIYGNGFVLTSKTLAAVPYNAASVVEDLEYHLALVRAGMLVEFAGETAVYGEIPSSGKGVKTQRARWEGGRIRILRERGPQLAGEIAIGRIRLLEPLLDLLLLPLAFHVALLLIAATDPASLPRIAGLTGLSIVGLHLIAAILAGHGTWRDVLILAMAPFYVAWKIVLIPTLFANAKSGTAWVRTERSTEKKTL